ncbi:MAG: phosphatase PAP2 family protein [Lachnospiraceae bacterium]|nr:phosphatase PAP2 family protein [Lachnospiraceae bacterium]
MIKKFYKERLKTALPILIYLPVYFIWFGMIELLPYRDFLRTDMGIDRSIPFIRQFIVPYFLWFLFVPGVGIYLLFKDKEEFKIFQILLIAGMTLFLVINTLMPTGINLRPHTVPGNDIFSVLVRFLYSIDTSTDVLPSIHVYNTIVACSCIFESKDKFAKSRPCRIAVIVITVLIILSTVFLKQHSVLDVVFGIAMYPFWDIIIRKYKSRKHIIAYNQ